VELAQQAARDIPHGQAVVIANCGHIPHLEHPDEFRTALMKFLSAQLP
jgi:pimeloyl-ACP methyl ester carboxylesterase